MGASKGSRTYMGRTIILAAIVLPMLLSCRDRHKQMADAVMSRDSCALMSTVGVTSLISENGLLKYRMETEDWQIFDRMDPPYWSFEKGAYLEVLDSLMQVASTIRCDTAYYYSDNKKWELRGGVHATNVDGEIFDTELLFWDQAKELVYSEAEVRVQQDQQVIHGHGFESDQSFTHYIIRKTDGIFPVEQMDGEPVSESGNPQE